MCLLQREEQTKKRIYLFLQQQMLPLVSAHLDLFEVYTQLVVLSSLAILVFKNKIINCFLLFIINKILFFIIFNIYY